MCKILIVYGSAYGQTERIVKEIAGILEQAGHAVTLVRGDRVPPTLPIEEHQGFVVAASVLFGRHQAYIREFVRAHVKLLSAAPSAFVSVCGAQAAANPRAAQEAQAYMDRFMEATGWTPRLAKSFAGGLPYTRYTLWTRWMMQLISRRTGRPTDASRDYDFTDWDEVRRFGAQAADLFASAVVALAGATTTTRAVSDQDEIC